MRVLSGCTRNPSSPSSTARALVSACSASRRVLQVITQSSANLVRAKPASAIFSSKTCKYTFESSGLATPPWGTPVSVGSTCPSRSTPASRNCHSSLNTLPSATLLATRSTRVECESVPEEVGDVGVNYPAVACLQLPPDAPHGHVRRTSRPKAIALVAERRLKDRFQNLDHRLLAHPVHHGGDAERPLGRGPWLVDLDPSHGTWPIAAILKPLMQEVEVEIPLLFESGDGYSVYTARAFVLLDALLRPGQIAWVVDLADQRVRLVRLHRLHLPGSPSSARRCPRLRRLGHCRSNHQSTFCVLACLQARFAISRRDPFPLTDAFWVARPPSLAGVGPEACVVPRFVSTSGHSDFSHRIPVDFTVRLIRPGTRPRRERDRTR